MSGDTGLLLSIHSTASRLRAAMSASESVTAFIMSAPAWTSFCAFSVLPPSLIWACASVAQSVQTVSASIVIFLIMVFCCVSVIFCSAAGLFSARIRNGMQIYALYGYHVLYGGK